MTDATLSPTAFHPVRLRETRETYSSPDLKHLVIVRGEAGESIVNLGTYRSESKDPERFLEHRLQVVRDRLRSARKAMKRTIEAIDMVTRGYIDTDNVQLYVNQIRAAQAAEPMLLSGGDIAELLAVCLRDVEEVITMADLEDETA